MDFVPTDEQEIAVRAILEWLCKGDKPQLRMGGWAGTGKSATLAYLRNLPEIKRRRVAVSAFTGKAVSVLRRKGVPDAMTLHSLMYIPTGDVRGKIVFVKRDELAYDLVVIDEASMISKILYTDLMSFGVPVLFVGDMGQLPPIGDDPYLMRDPELKLETIHRQAAGSPIIQFSASVRRGMWNFDPDPPRLTFGNYGNFLDVLLDVDQVICGFNDTRESINKAFREHHGYKGVLCEGEKVICLRNDYKVGVFNGLMGTVQQIHEIGPQIITATVADDLGRKLTVDMSAAQFGKKQCLMNMEDGPRPFYVPGLTFWVAGYALTCHRAQGSEWESVAVYEEIGSSWDRLRWAYTAITRGRERLVYCR